jgi:acyl carrier protein
VLTRDVGEGSASPPGLTMPTARLCRIEPEEVATVLTSFINTSIMARGHPVQPDDDLELAGLDSMALLKILLFVEAEFGFWMPDHDLVPENIKSPRTLATYICRRRSQP